jgi:hypothetical protein
LEDTELRPSHGKSLISSSKEKSTEEDWPSDYSPLLHSYFIYL